ncbi:MAG: VOC family protein [Sulfuriferula sp.]
MNQLLDNKVAALTRMIVRIIGIEHIQLAMPPGEELRARDFYSGILGIPETPKPPALAARGGVWFERHSLKIHLGVETNFHPANKAHPGLLVENLEQLVKLLRAAGYSVIDDEPLAGFFRVYVSDPFGNRIELMTIATAVKKMPGRNSTQTMCPQPENADKWRVRYRRSKTTPGKLSPRHSTDGCRASPHRTPQRPATYSKIAAWNS